MQYTDSGSHAAIAQDNNTPLGNQIAIHDTVSKMQTARAHDLIATRRGERCKTGSTWSKRYANEATAAKATVAESQAVLDDLYRRNEANAARERVTTLPLYKFRVLDCTRPMLSTGRYPEVLDQLRCNEVLIDLFTDAHARNITIQSGYDYRVDLPGCQTYLVEVL